MISVLRMFYSVKYLIPWYVGSKKYVIPESSKEIESKSDQIYLIIKPLVSFNLGFSYLHVYSYVYVRVIRLWYTFEVCILDELYFFTFVDFISGSL